MKTKIFVILLVWCLDIYTQQVRHPFYKGSNSIAGNFLFPDNSVLDSINNYNSDSSLIFRTHYLYDKKGNRTCATYIDFNFKETHSCEFSYDQEGKLISSIVTDPDEPYMMKTIYVYNASNNRLEKEFYSITFDSITWLDRGKSEIFYNKEGLIECDFRITEKNDSSRVVYTYDTVTNKKTLFKEEYKYLDKWILEQKTEYHYNSKNLLSSLSTYVSREDKMYLLREIKYIYIDTSISEIEENWYGATYNSLSPDGNTKTTITPTEKKILERKNENGFWKNISEEKISYNEKGQKIGLERYYANGNILKGSYKEEIIYKNDKPFSEIIYWFDQNQWKLNLKRYYHYSHIPTDVTSMIRFKPNKKLKPEIKSLPGMISIDNTQINAFSFCIFTIDGRLIRKEILHSGLNYITTHHLKGKYIIRINNSDGVYSQKICLK